MEVSKLEKQVLPKETNFLSIANLEILLNTINHAIIAIITFYCTWYCIKAGFTSHLSLHTFISTIGYQILMAEGIMVMYKRNTYTFLVRSRETKSTIHWIMLAAGSLLAIAGTVVEYVWREQNHRSHGYVHHRHAWWGQAFYMLYKYVHSVYRQYISGLVSLFCLLPTMLSGLFALLPQRFKRFLKPLFSKFTHNLFATIAFVTGMVSLAMGYTDLRWSKTYDPGEFRTYMAWFLGIVTVITMIGPVRTFFNQGRSFLGR